MVNSSARLNDVFSALADPTRRGIVAQLARGPLSVGELAAGFAISQPGISRHVKVLERAGLLKRHVVGRVHHCRLEPKAMEVAASWLETQREYWNATFDRLDAYLARTSPRKKKT
jgi:DNA-binding transcriptional ArsR family regulator